MDKVQQLRHRAGECRVKAHRALSPDIGAYYRQLAAVWEKLADERLAYFVPKDPKSH
jgi:hypothetical protein